MDNNVVIPVNLMRANILHNITHGNNVHCLAIDGGVFAFYRDEDQKERMKDFIIVSTYRLNIINMIYCIQNIIVMI